MLKKLQVLLLTFLALQSGTVLSQNNGLAFESSNIAATTDDYVTVANGSSFLANSSAMSITCWVYPTNAAPAYPDFDGFAGIRNDLDADFYLLQVGANAVEGRFTNSTGSTFTITSSVLTLNTWQHLALTYGNGWLKLYKNSVAVDSIAASGTILSSNVPFYIGKVQYTGASFNLKGRMDETSLWSRELSANELTCLPAEGIDSTASGLELLYRFNQGIANGNNAGITTLLDATGTANGVLNGFTLSGNTSNFVAGASLINTTTGFTCPDVPYTWNGQTIYTAGLYSDTLVSSNGCDSIIQLQLGLLAVDTVVTLNWNTLTANHVGLTYQWLDCNNGYAPVPGATSRVFSPTTPGSYAVDVTQGACHDTSGCHAVVTVGLETLNVNADISIQPSVTSSTVKVVFAKSAAGVVVSVMDNSGKEIISGLQTDGREIEFDLSSFANGLYFVRVDDGSRSGLYKVVKQ